MSKKPKKLKQKSKKGGKRGNRTAASAYKGTIIRVARTHGFLQDSIKGSEFFVAGRDLLGAVAGDTVLFEKTGRQRDSVSLKEVRVVKILKSSDSPMTGTVVTDEDGNLSLSPDSFGSRYPLEIFENSNMPNIKVGDKVGFTIKSRGSRHHEHIAEIMSVYGSSASAQVCVQAYLDEKGICPEFSPECEEEAKASGDSIERSEIPNRLDLRDLPIFTIDGADTKDIDDAISIERVKGGYKLGVHIADVSHYVTAKSPLDQSAFSRGTSVYIADLVVPMLPKALSNGICSLNPNVERLSFSCLMEVAKSGELKSFEFKKTVIRSRVQGVYSEVNEILEVGTDKANENLQRKYSEVIEQLPIMLELSLILKKNREARNAPALESAECKIICDSDTGRVIDIKRRESGANAVSEAIIEEFMLLANNAAARLAMEKQLPFVYRVHEPPAAEKLTRLSETLQSLGIPVPELKPTAESFSKVIETARKSEISESSEKFDVVNMAVLRAMMKAKYSQEPLGHFGLVMKEYAHFTSPIRRYPDLSIHRILSDYVAGVPITKLSKIYGKFVHESSLSSTATELKAVNAERDCNGFYFAEYMSDKIGLEFDGTISGVTEISVYVSLENTVEGRVLLSDGYESNGVSISNSLTGVRYTLGDKVKVKCIGCSVPLGRVDFEIR